MARAVDDVSVTQTGHIAGTPQFMSPEQAQGEVIDARSDLFSLGSVLYTMCTGRPPFRADSAVAMLRRVIDDDPRQIGEVNPETPPWLEAIVFKLLAKQPRQRFASADEVATLLSEHLAHLQHPDSVAPPKPVSRPTKKPAPAGRGLRTWLAAAFAAGLILAGVLVAAVIVHIMSDRGTLVIETREDGFRIVIEDDGETVKILDGVNMINGVANVPVVLRSGEYQLKPLEGESVEIKPSSVVVKRGERVVVRVTRLEQSAAAGQSGLGPAYPAQQVAIRTSDGLYWRSGGDNQPVLADAITYRRDSPFLLLWEDPQRSATYIRTHDGLFVGAPQDDRIVTRQERENSERFRVEWVDRGRTLRLKTAGGYYLYVRDDQGTLDTIRFANAASVFTLVPFDTATAQDEPAAESITLMGRFVGHEGVPGKAAFLPDSRHVVSCADDDRLLVWDIVTRRVERILQADAAVATIALSPDGRMVAAGGRKSKSILLWDTQTGERMGELTGDEAGSVSALAFFPDQSRLLSASYADKTLHVWNLDQLAHSRSIEVGLGINEMQVLPVARADDNQQAILAGAEVSGWGFELYDLKRGGRLTGNSLLSCFAVSQDSRQLLAGHINGMITLMETGTQDVRAQMRAPGNEAIMRAAICPDDRFAVTATRKNKMHVWDLNTRKLLTSIEDNSIAYVWLSPDGRFAVTRGLMATRGSSFSVWRLPERVWPPSTDAPDSPDAATDSRRERPSAPVAGQTPTSDLVAWFAGPEGRMWFRPAAEASEGDLSWTGEVTNVSQLGKLSQVTANYTYLFHGTREEATELLTSLDLQLASIQARLGAVRMPKTVQSMRATGTSLGGWGHFYRTFDRQGKARHGMIRMFFSKSQPLEEDEMLRCTLALSIAEFSGSLRDLSRLRQPDDRLHPVVDEMLKRLPSSSPQQRLQWIGQLKSVDAFVDSMELALTLAVDDEDEQVAQQALRAVAEIGEESEDAARLAVSVMSQLVAREDAPLQRRALAARSLGEMGERWPSLWQMTGAIARLMKVLEDLSEESEELVDSALWSLGQVAGHYPELLSIGVAGIERIARDHPSRAVRRQAAEVVDRIRQAQ